jgi:hypothetical protein
MGGGRDG